MRANLNLRQIETFRAVMICGSIIGAAKLMNVTQPGVSRTIGLLEDKVGYALFQRRGRRIVPTPEAQALYREVEKSYRSIEHIAHIAHDIGTQRAGALRIAAFPALAQWLVPKAISRFLAARPNVTIFVHGLPSVQIAELVSTQQFDVGIVELPLLRPAIDIEELPVSHLVAVVPEDHRLAAASKISIMDLDGERMILLSQHSFVRYQIDDAFSKYGGAPKVVLETPNSSMACALVSAGAGIALVARLTAEPFMKNGIVIRHLDESLVSRSAIIFPQLTTRSTLADAFAADVREEIEDFTRSQSSR
jgi:DNA-binding transcriptional LysR family regulator